MQLFLAIKTGYTIFVQKISGFKLKLKDFFFKILKICRSILGKIKNVHLRLSSFRFYQFFVKLISSLFLHAAIIFFLFTFFNYLVTRVRFSYGLIENDLIDISIPFVSFLLMIIFFDFVLLVIRKIFRHKQSELSFANRFFRMLRDWSLILLITLLQASIYIPIILMIIVFVFKKKMLFLDDIYRKAKYKILLVVTQFVEKYRSASSQEKVLLLKKSIIFLILLFLINRFGHIFLPPKIVTSFPGNEAVEISLDSKIEIQFNKNMMTSSVEKSLRIEPQVEGELSWIGDSRVVFTPSEPFERNSSYQIIIGRGAMSSIGIPKIIKTDISFTTLGHPQVVLASPLGQSLVEKPTFTIMFDRAMIPLTTVDEKEKATPAFSIDPPIEGEGRWLGTTAYQFRPTSELSLANTYSYVVRAGIKSEDGGELQDDQVFSFSTPRPIVVSISPTNGYQYANPVASVSATLTQQADLKSAQESFTLYELDEKNEIIAEVEASVRVLKEQVGFYPNRPLKRNSKYKAVIKKGLKSIYGENGLENDYEWEFGVTQLPSVYSTDPEDGEDNVVEDNWLKVEFSTPMDSDSFEGNVIIDPAPEKNPSLNSYRGKIGTVLSVGTYLRRSENYTITIGANVRDQYGVPLRRNYSFGFHTSDMEKSISILPTNTYFATFNQAVKPRIVAKTSAVKGVEYHLYKISKEQLIDLYKLRQDYSLSNERRSWQSLDLSKYELVRSWSENYEADKNIPVNVITIVEKENGESFDPGLYFLDAVIEDGHHDNLVMILTNTALTAKWNTDQALIWATDQGTGNVVEGADVEIVNFSFDQKASGKTNNDGVYLSESKQGLFSDNNYNNQIDSEIVVFAHRNNDTSVLFRSWDEGIDNYDFGIQHYYDPQERDSYYGKSDDLKIFIQLDRPIYRPGQKVYFKGVVRSDDDGVYSLLDEGETVNISLYDSSGKVVANRDLPLNSYGSFSGDFDLSENGALGSYRINASINGNGFEQSFQVEEYKRAEFEVSIKTNRSKYVSGEKIDVEVDSKYYFGAPVPNAKLKWTLATEDSPFAWLRDRRFDFGDSDNYWYRPWWSLSDSSYFSGEKIAEGTGFTNYDGKYNVLLPTNISDKTASQRYRLEVEIENEDKQVIAGTSQEIYVYHGSLMVGLKPEKYVGRANQESKVEIVTLDLEGVEQPNKPVEVSFYKRTWSTIKEQDPEDNQFYWVSKHTDNFISKTMVQTDDMGRTSAEFIPESGGLYHVVAQVIDDSGRIAKAGTDLWISGGGWSSRLENHDRIALMPDSQEYEIGQSAQIQASIPYSQVTGLITSERANVLDYQIVHLDQDNQIFSVDLKDNYSPNVFVSGVFVKGGKEVKDPPQFKMGLLELRVSNKRNKVNLEISTDQEQYRPGDKMIVNLDTKNGLGESVKSEVALALVDQSVWSLARTELVDIFQTFYRPRNLAVSTAQSLITSMDRINANVNLGSKGGSGGGCFTGLTKISMANGSFMNMEEVAVGDFVLTRLDETDNNLVKAKVNKIFVHDVDNYLIINNKLEVTGIHRVYTQKGWQEASNLKQGDRLLRDNGKWEKVSSIETINKKVRVYNLEIDQFHTYLANGYWVHNDKGGPDTSRDEFLDTAYWNAHIETNDSGNAQVEVNLPDNTTTWRIIGVAITKDTAVGDAVEKVIASKDTVIQPLLPRFLSIGDQPRVGVRIHNNSNNSANYSISMSSTGLSTQDELTKEVVVSPHSSQNVYWQGEVLATEKVSFEFISKLQGQMVDGIKIELPVLSYFVPEVVAASGEAKDQALENIYLPSSIVPDQGELAISLSPILGGGVQTAAKYMFNYYYWCNEQTISRLSVLANLLELADEMGNQNIGGYSRQDVERLIEDSVARLTKTQMPDGGWSWSNGDRESNSYISTLVMEGLLQAQRQNLGVSGQVVRDGLSYLEAQLDNPDNSLDSQAMIAAILAENRQVSPSKLSTLMNSRWQMSTIARAYLLRSLLLTSKSSADGKRLMNEMLSLVDKTNTLAHWESQSEPWQFMGGKTSLTAVMLENLVIYNKSHALIPDVTRWLVQVRENGYWQTTRQTSVAVRSIVSMIIGRKEAKVDYDWKIDLAGSRVAEGKMTKDDVMNELLTTIGLSEIEKEKDVSLAIEKAGTGSLYYNLNLSYWLPFEEVEPTDQGIVIIRDLIDAAGNPLSIDRVSNEGEVIVRLTLAVPAERHHVIIEDNFPAGFEPVNESLATTSILNSELPDISDDKDQLYFKSKEIHDDRVVLFAETVPAGVYEYIYRVRPTLPGRYHYPPAQAYNMYFPDVFGRSAGGWIEIIESK